LRQSVPNAVIVVGGPHLSLYPDECMTVEAIDVAVVGEGEVAIAGIMRRVQTGEPLAGLPGTVSRENGTLVHGPAADPIADLDSVPMPALDLLPLDRYWALTLPRPLVTMVTSRGCPCRCRYCSQAYVGGRYREHGAERVVAEMERAVRTYGAREIVFFDESFTINRERVADVCRLVRDRGLRVRWNIRTRADSLTRETMRELVCAGCYGIHVGVESGSPRIQKLMNKNLDLDRVARLFHDARAEGLETRGYFMIGYPGETRQEIRQTIRFSRTLDLDWASFSITTPAAGADIYRDALDSGRFPSDYWRDYTLDRADGPPEYFTSGELSVADLKRHLRKAYGGFYLRPRLIFRKLISRRLWRSLGETVRALAVIARARIGAVRDGI
jgi:radical SAM superfamily enzyme YgiQ (UPF0313 family)